MRNSKLLVIAFFCSFYALISAQTYQNQRIAFLKNLPEATVDKATPEDLMQLLDESSAEYVESIECGNVSLNKQRAGVLLKLVKEDTDPSFVKFNFKPAKLLNGYRIITYVNDLDGTGNVVNIDYNNIPYTSGISGTDSFKFDSTVATSSNCSSLLNYMSGFTKNIYINGDAITSTPPIRSITVTAPVSNGSKEIQFLGVRIIYTGTTDESGKSTIVEESSFFNSNDEVVYYDIAGRRLTSAPTSGLYLRRCGSKTEKLIAPTR